VTRSAAIAENEVKEVEEVKEVMEKRPADSSASLLLGAK
jgi:hypothetical protein